MTSNAVKEYGSSIGYDAVGIIPADRLSGYAAEIISRGDMYNFFAKKLTSPPQQKMPEAKSVIVLIRDYFREDFPENLKKMIGKIYLARYYDQRPDNIEHARLRLMKDYVSARGYAVSSDIFVPARWAAAQAGIAGIGRNNFAYAECIGSYIIIHTFLIDKELEYDKPSAENKCPPNCMARINACPTKALYEPFRMDPRRCIAFNNWVTQDGRGAVSSYIPNELRKGIGCNIHGCDARTSARATPKN